MTTPELAAAAPLVFLVAGEASGDRLGGRLMMSLRAATGGMIRFDGVVGPMMAEQGLVSRFPMAELSLMGLTEILPHIPRLWGRLRSLASLMEGVRPAALVTIDAPAFNLRLARRVAHLGLPRIHYVAPQVWAWRPARAKAIAKACDHLMTLLPFEPPYFSRFGLAASYVGHPVIETARPGDGVAFREKWGLDADQPVLLVLPGSRLGEVRRLMAVFGESVRAVGARLDRLAVVVVAAAAVAPEVRARLAGWPQKGLVVCGEDDKFAAFAAADAALAASGTVSLELALCRCPTVAAYRLNAMTMAMARRFARLPWVSLANIILGREVIPEFLQERCTPALLSASLLGLLESDAARAAQRAGFDELAIALEAQGPPPSMRAAQTLLQIMGGGAMMASAIGSKA